jgi:transcriptional regulator with XRE-family HTH domain
MPHKPFTRTLRAQWFGHHLRTLREKRGMTLNMAAQILNRDRSALGRYERAEWPVPRYDAETLLSVYGCHEEEERAQLLAVVDDLWRTDRWIKNGVAPDKAFFIDVPWLESRAERICSYHATLMPGLFQLPEYAELVIRRVEGRRASEEKITRFIELRMTRQRILDDPHHAKMETVIDEGVLRRQIGGRTLLRAQLAHLAKIARRPRVEIRVLPAQVALHPGLDGSFWIFRMPAPYPAVAYQENRAGRFFVESPNSESFLDAYDEIRETALDPVESLKLVTTIEEELS